MKTRKFCYIAVALFLILSCTLSSSVAYANAIYYPSSWSSQKIAISKILGITPEGFDTQPFNESITRKDFCELLINTSRTYGTTLPSPPMTAPFTDTKDIVAETAYMLGLTQGTTAGIFSPDLPLTREMAAVMLSKLRMLFQSTSGNNDRNEPDYFGNSLYDSKRNYGVVSTTSTGSLTYTQPMDEQQAAQALSKYSTDSYLISDWAKTYMADVYTQGILSGTGDGKLDPKSYITREQAAILSLNILAYCDELQIRAAGVKECILPAPTGIFISPSYYMGDVYLNWNDIPLASAYDITVYKDGKSAYTARVDNNYLDLRTRTTTYNRETRAYAYEEIANPLYKSIFEDEKLKIHAAIKIVPVNENGEPSVFSLTKEFTIDTWSNRNEMIFGDSAKNSFVSNSEALLYMKSIKVNIWKLNSSGAKTTSILTLTVNRNVAESVTKIFTEIYNGNEKFPIINGSGYAFRNGKSEHSRGTAIDINHEENYFVEWGGAIKAGSLWKPGINPYSIIPGGDVVSAFNRYGWHWSPDMNWPNGADYMHFSLGGT